MTKDDNGDMEFRINGWKAPSITIILAIIFGGGGSVIGSAVTSPAIVRLESRLEAIDQRLIELSTLQKAMQIDINAHDKILTRLETLADIKEGVKDGLNNEQIKRRR